MRYSGNTVFLATATRCSSCWLSCLSFFCFCLAGACWTRRGECICKARRALFLHEGAFDHVVAGLTDARRYLEAAPVEQVAGVFEHVGAAADHGAIGRWVERRQADVLEQLAALDQIMQASLIAEGLARDRGIINKLLAHNNNKKNKMRQRLGDEFLVSEVVHVAHA